MNKFLSPDILPDDMPEKYMQEAIAESKKGITADIANADIPVGCIIIDKNGEIIARAHNTRKANHSITEHAEINAINEYTQKTGNFILDGATVFVTLEPCPMCAGALSAARPKAVYYGAPNSENGSCGTIFNILNGKTKVYGGIKSQEISLHLSDFFKTIRKSSH